MAKLNVLTPFNIELEFDIASLGKRALAYFIDIMVGVVYVLLLHLTILETAIEIEGLFDVSQFFLVILPLFFYHFFSEMLMNGQSLGKKVIGIRVVNKNGNAASISQYLLRWILSLPNIMFVPVVGYLVWVSPWLGFVTIGILALPDAICYAVTKSGQRIGDLAANTVVVSTRHSIDIEQTIFREVSLDTGYQPKYPQVMRLTDKDINSLRNLLKQKRTKDLDTYTTRVAERIETVLQISNDSADQYHFFEELLTDYNYYVQTK